MTKKALKKRTVKVQEIPGEPLAYWVESWAQPEFQHKVDLTENGGNGFCDCKDFCTRCQPNFDNNGGRWVEYGYPGHPDPERTQCRHIFVARKKFLNTTLRQIAEQISQEQK